MYCKIGDCQCILNAFSCMVPDKLCLDAYLISLFLLIKTITTIISSQQYISSVAMFTGLSGVETLLQK